MNKYAIATGHFNAEFFSAETPGRAKYKAFKAIRNCGYQVSFRDFLKGLRCTRITAADVAAMEAREVSSSAGSFA